MDYEDALKLRTWRCHRLLEEWLFSGFPSAEYLPSHIRDGFFYTSIFCATDLVSRLHIRFVMTPRYLATASEREGFPTCDFAAPGLSRWANRVAQK